MECRESLQSSLKQNQLEWNPLMRNPLERNPLNEDQRARFYQRDPFVEQDEDDELWHGQDLTLKGPIEVEDKAIYRGQWSAGGLRHGKGTQVWPDGSKYDGYWVMDRFHHRGRLIHCNGDYYSG